MAFDDEGGGGGGLAECERVGPLVSDTCRAGAGEVGAEADDISLLSGNVALVEVSGTVDEQVNNLLTSISSPVVYIVKW